MESVTNLQHAMATTTITPSVATLDTRGDLILVVGKDEHEIRVPSKPLCDASHFMATLANGGWREGTEAKSRSSTNPYRLSLPEDSYEHMKAICAILHLRNDMVPQPHDINEKWLLTFALLVHKYDFGPAVKFAGHYLLRHFTDKWLAMLTSFPLPKAVGYDLYNRINTNEGLQFGLPSLIYAAYALDDASCFYAATKALCLSISSSQLDRKQMLIETTFQIDVLPSEFWPSFYLVIKENYDTLSASINDQMKRLGNRHRDYERGDERKQHGYLTILGDRYIPGVHDALSSQDFHEQLIRLSLWPYSPEMKEWSLARHVERLKELKNLHIGTWSNTSGDHRCRACKTSISQLGHAIAEEVLDKVV